MGVPYDTFTGAFLAKITEYELPALSDTARQETVDGYMKRAVSAFKNICRYDMAGNANDRTREYEIDVAPDELDELVDIVSEGMLVQWLKPYVYKQELLENAMNTRDFSVYSPAELLMRIGNAYTKAQKDYTQMVREYSYNTGDLTVLHL